MDDHDLETRIRAAETQPASLFGLTEHSTRILTEARVGHRRRFAKMAVGVAASLVIVGSGAAAVASNGLETPWGWTADNVYQFPGPNGQICFSGLIVKPDGVAEDSEAVLAAKKFVADLDLSKLDTSAAIAELEAENGQPFDDGSPGVLHYSRAEIAQGAMHQTVADLLFRELTDRGLMSEEKSGSVSLQSQAQGCQ